MSGWPNGLRRQTQGLALLPCREGSQWETSGPLERAEVQIPFLTNIFWRNLDFYYTWYIFSHIVYIYLLIAKNSLGFFNNFFVTIWKKINTMHMTQARSQAGVSSDLPPPPCHQASFRGASRGLRPVLASCSDLRPALSRVWRSSWQWPLASAAQSSLGEQAHTSVSCF